MRKTGKVKNFLRDLLRVCIIFLSHYKAVVKKWNVIVFDWGMNALGIVAKFCF